MSNNPAPEIIGQIISGKYAELYIRQKAQAVIELGDLIVAEDATNYQILQVTDLEYASQIPDKAQELMSGLKLEGLGKDLQVFEPELRNYVIAIAHSLVHVQKLPDRQQVVLPKVLPAFFREMRRITPQDLAFLTKPPNPVYLGQVRSGSKVMNVEVFLNGYDMIPHHVLVAATTGRGKSNFMKGMLWNLLDDPKVGMLVMDPHDEYYGRRQLGLKDHPNANNNLKFYSPNPVSGRISSKSLKINIESLEPQDFIGCMDISDPQEQTMQVLFRSFQQNWIIQLVTIDEDTAKSLNINMGTLSVLRRKFHANLGIEPDLSDPTKIIINNRVFTQGAGGQSTLVDIINDLENAKLVVIDTSQVHDAMELLIGSMLAKNLLHKYQNYKFQGTLEQKPPVGVVLEEAPRVLSKDALKSGDNIFSTLAKEGRKFKVGLIAITQLTSIIPTVILANMNTKVILGNENKPERSALIDSACQDLSQDDRNIASLDKGEAIISSTFTRFAVPVKFPLFEELVQSTLKAVKASKKSTKIEL